ncbi:hypothetical protein EIP91_010323 [Steccherinum ochraceum]|uniref:Uncharacterized protein n=1 Tax=Steccherinum ochraceum TaxID=92696 RepID=A0A4R0R8P4_9APHY|nr:hypothetical protein EIP91_010323 [Steccherinum ochraceum]
MRLRYTNVLHTLHLDPDSFRSLLRVHDAVLLGPIIFNVIDNNCGPSPPYLEIASAPRSFTSLQCATESLFETSFAPVKQADLNHLHPLSPRATDLTMFAPLPSIYAPTTHIYLRRTTSASSLSAIPSPTTTILSNGITADSLYISDPDVTLTHRALEGLLSPSETWIRNLAYDSRWADGMWTDLSKHGTETNLPPICPHASSISAATAEEELATPISTKSLHSRPSSISPDKKHRIMATYSIEPSVNDDDPRFETITSPRRWQELSDELRRLHLDALTNEFEGHSTFPTAFFVLKMDKAMFRRCITFITSNFPSVRRDSDSEEVVMQCVAHINANAFHMYPASRRNDNNRTMLPLASAMLDKPPSKKYDLSWGKVITNIRAIEQTRRTPEGSETTRSIVVSDSLRLRHNFFPFKSAAVVSLPPVNIHAYPSRDSARAQVRGLGAVLRNTTFSLLDWHRGCTTVSARQSCTRILTSTNCALQPLPAYDTDGGLISPADYIACLAGATAHVSFSVAHQPFPRAHADEYYADVRRIQVLVPPSV